VVRILIHTPVVKPNWLNIISTLELRKPVRFAWYITKGQDNQNIYDIRGQETDGRWRKFVADKMNRARELVLSEGYDYMLNIEHDHMFTPNTLELLLKHAKPDIYISALYRPRPSRNPRSVYCLHIKAQRGGRFPDKEFVDSNELIKAFTVVFGFTLFGRKVLERLDFDEGLDGTFAWKAERVGIKRYVLTTARIAHIDRDGKVYWAWLDES